MAGGYQQPTNPAPVSGPGALSQRTDGGLTQAPMVAPGGAYGERSDMLDLQASAPMAASPSITAVPFTAPSERPGEPVTTGVAAGAGPGPEILSSPNSPVTLASILRKMIAYDDTGDVSILHQVAVERGW